MIRLTHRPQTTGMSGFNAIQIAWRDVAGVPQIPEGVDYFLAFVPEPDSPVFTAPTLMWISEAARTLYALEDDPHFLGLRWNAEYPVTCWDMDGFTPPQAPEWLPTLAKIATGELNIIHALEDLSLPGDVREGLGDLSHYQRRRAMRTWTVLDSLCQACGRILVVYPGNRDVTRSPRAFPALEYTMPYDAYFLPSAVREVGIWDSRDDAWARQAIPTCGRWALTIQTDRTAPLNKAQVYAKIVRWASYGDRPPVFVGLWTDGRYESENPYAWDAYVQGVRAGMARVEQESNTATEGGRR